MAAQILRFGVGPNAVTPDPIEIRTASAGDAHEAWARVEGLECFPDGTLLGSDLPRYWDVRKALMLATQDVGHGTVVFRGGLDGRLLVRHPAGVNFPAREEEVGG